VLCKPFFPVLTASAALAKGSGMRERARLVDWSFRRLENDVFHEAGSKA
jgi:hypothetical protein